MCADSGSRIGATVFSAAIPSVGRVPQHLERCGGLIFAPNASIGAHEDRIGPRPRSVLRVALSLRPSRQMAGVARLALAYCDQIGAGHRNLPRA
jgi:hypothetical protein